MIITITIIVVVVFVIFSIMDVQNKCWLRLALAGAYKCKLTICRLVRPGHTCSLTYDLTIRLGS